MLRYVNWSKFTDVSEVLTDYIIVAIDLLIKSVRTSSGMGVSECFGFSSLLEAVLYAASPHQSSNYRRMFSGIKAI